MANWQPSTSVSNLRLRAELLARVREFFSQRNVLEVETPLLWPTTATDPHLDSIKVDQVFTRDSQTYYLQTSPEFAMKKLLCYGSGSIFQICKAFRRDERSKRHNPEFTMLEWYRVGFDEWQLMDEVEELVTILIGCAAPQRISYRQLFQQHLSIDPHCCSDAALLEVARQHVNFDDSGYLRDELLHLLLGQVIEPALKHDYFVYDFPASMAALATVETDETGTEVARRFELFVGGMEIANGYRELIDPVEQKRRFEQDIQQRRDELPVDNDLIAALDQGMPACAGVAIGIDRLLMLVAKAGSIDEVIGFGLNRR
ncbi:MAG: EF-P lysine aminoacylase GenX [Gammaproteobacteria bacterium]|nr:EF-P lysine aminoacylase GenX [Gammaproteobacteria bacterium]